MQPTRLEGKIDKGWGYELIWATNEHYCGKIMVFEKVGSKFSMHFHKEKDESWFVNNGRFLLNYVDTTTAAPTSGQVLIWNGTNWAPGTAASAGLDFDSSIQTASFNAVVNKGYFVDTAGGVLTVTLPSSPSVGDEVHVIDSSNSAATFNITIGRGGNPIASSATDLTVAVNGAAFRLIYSGSSTFGWVLMNK